MHIEGSDAFAARMHMPSFIDAVIEIYVHLHTVGIEDASVQMQRIFHKEASGLMDNLYGLRQKLHECSDRDTLCAFLVTLYRRKNMNSYRATIESWSKPGHLG